MDVWTKSMLTPTGRTATTIVALFKTVVSHEIISADLSYNPSVPEDVVRSAVDLNSPERFLPQPWPPVDTSDLNGLSIATLLKMKCLVSAPLKLQTASADNIRERIASEYPSVRSDEQTPDSTRFTAVTSLTEDGDVFFEFNHPGGSNFPLDSLSNPGTTTIDYVTKMTALAIAQDLQRLGF
jgi:hypothetical protein